MKDIHGVHPELAVCDLSPSMIGAVSAVFGEHVLGIDGFHVMQELNNGIRRDLLDFRDGRFKTEINDLHATRDWISRVQEGIANGMPVVTAITAAGVFPEVDSCHEMSQTARHFTSQVLDLVIHEDPGLFFSELASFLEQNEASSCEHVRSFVHDMRPAIPAIRFTEKGMLRVEKTLLRKLKTFYLDFRAKLEEESTQFYKDHWVVFFQPERMTGPRQERLDGFLARYPELNVYRTMTLQVGEIYRLPVEAIDGHQITTLEEQPGFSEKLNTAIKTLKKHAASILRFVDVFKRNPGLPKRCRATTEWSNVRFKKPFKAGNNLVKKEHLLIRLRAQLHGTIDWRIPEAKVI